MIERKREMIERKREKEGLGECETSCEVFTEQDLMKKKRAEGAERETARGMVIWRYFCQARSRGRKEEQSTEREEERRGGTKREGHNSPAILWSWCS